MFDLPETPISTRKAIQVSERDWEVEEVCSSSAEMVETGVPQKVKATQDWRQKASKLRAIPRDVASTRSEP